MIMKKPLTTLDLSGLNLESVSEMMEMFYGCSNLETLILGGSLPQYASVRDRAFKGCGKLKRIYCDPGTAWDAYQGSQVFEGCYSLEGYCPERTTPYNSSFVTVAYARVCTPDEDGYFTSMEYLPSRLGDVNDDGVINISDVTTLIDYLLGGSLEHFNIANANVNMDSKISISDVTALIDLLLSGE